MEIKKFRNPRMANYEGERMLHSEVMQESCDDLKYDARILAKDPRENIWKRLNQGGFACFAQRRFNHNQEVITDYLFIFNKHEQIRFATDINDNITETIYRCQLP